MDDVSGRTDVGSAVCGAGGRRVLGAQKGLLVRVNGDLEMRRGKKLVAGDVAEYNGQTVKIES